MRKNYEAPMLFVDEYVADTMIASSEDDEMPFLGWNTKNGNAGNNQNCWGCRDVPGQPNPDDPSDACLDYADSAYNDFFC